MIIHDNSHQCEVDGGNAELLRCEATGDDYIHYEWQETRDQLCEQQEDETSSHMIIRHILLLLFLYIFVCQKVL